LTPAAALRPVVIQTMWRTGGTYLAFALREQNPVALFYEPLHEDYSKFTQAQWDGFAAIGDAASRGHPIKRFHYLTDFPFLPGAGVVGHSSDFAYRRFRLGRDDEAPALGDYLSGLVASAAAQGRRPLFKFCRAFLRHSWLERRLDPITVFLARRPAGMRASYARTGPYFDSGYLRMLSQNRNDPALAPLFAHVADLHPEFSRADPDAAGDSLAGAVAAETREDVFLFFWALALVAHAAPHILTLEAEALGADVRSRLASAEALRSHTGLVVNLDEARPLDRAEWGEARFRRPDVMAPLTRAAAAVVAPARDLRGLPPALVAQAQALLAD
jgi:hypothetical protein